VESGIRLEVLPAADMLDVLHYYFETDAVGEKEEQDAKLKLRRSIYRTLYQRPYTWQDDSDGGEFGTQDASGSPVNRPAKFEHKPYVPPTPVNPNSPKPYGNVLDAPLA
jgi:hypothetical protein